MKKDTETRRRGDAERNQISLGCAIGTRGLRGLLLYGSLGLAILLLGGCLSVNAQAPRTVGTDSSATAAHPVDGRTNAQLIEENKALRTRAEGLEKANQDLEVVVKQKQDYLHQLEKQSKETQKKLDRYKKSLKD